MATKTKEITAEQVIAQYVDMPADQPQDKEGE